MSWRKAACLGAKPRSRSQGAGDPSAAAEAAVGSAQATLDDGDLARGAADEARRRTRSVAQRMAPGVIKVAADSASFSFRLDRNKLRQARSREGRYLLRTNLVEEDPAKLWSHYLLLVAVEEAFKNLKSLPPRRRGATWRSGRSFTSARHVLRPTSSSPSWPIACTSLLRGACMRWRPG